MAYLPIFDKFPNIGEKVFEQLNGEDLLNARLVCKSWNSILGRSLFWLKKLKKLGQCPEVTEKWTTLIMKAKDLGNLQEESICSCLRYKYVLLSNLTNSSGVIDDPQSENLPIFPPPIFAILSNREKRKKFHLNEPPLLTIVRFEDLTILEMIVESDENCLDIPIKTSTRVSRKECVIFLALRKRNDSMVKLMLSKMKTPIRDIVSSNKCKLIHIAIHYGNLGLVKLLFQIDGKIFDHKIKLPELPLAENKEYPIFLAITMEHSEMATYILSKMKIHWNQLRDRFGHSFLRAAILDAPSEPTMLDMIKFLGENYEKCFDEPLSDPWHDLLIFEFLQSKWYTNRIARYILSKMTIPWDQLIDNQGYSFLYMAIYNGNLGMVQYISDHDENVFDQLLETKPHHEKEFPIFEAMRKKHVDIVKLIKSKMKISLKEIQDKDGNSYKECYKVMNKKFEELKIQILKH